MAQTAKIIDVTKSFVPGDPNSFPQNLSYTEGEDRPEKEPPILAYEGYNFMPTVYGVRSYFGENATLAIRALASRPQFVLLYQTSQYESILIALCEDGIWTAYGDGSVPAWIQQVTLTYDEAVFLEWTYCIIENTLYMYQQAGSVVYKTATGSLVVPEIPAIPAVPAVPPFNGSAEIPAVPTQTITDTLIISNFAPTFLNMAGQMGIFRAGTRLGFWDSANSVSWSSNFELNNFTPSLENLAGNRIWGDVVGRIVTIKSHGDGYIIYSTKSITGVNFTQDGTLLWDARKILDNTGISYSRAVTFGQTDSDHFAFTTSGMYIIGKFNPITGKHENQHIMPEISDYLLEDRQPVYLSCSQSRYLFLSLINADYIYGLLSAGTVSVDPYRLDLSWYDPQYEVTAPSFILPGITLYEEVFKEILGQPTPGNFSDNVITNPVTGVKTATYPVEDSENYNPDSPLPDGTTKRQRTDNRKWVPLFETKIDLMDTRYYAWWKNFRDSSETEGLIDFSDYAPEIDQLDFDNVLTNTILQNSLNARPVAGAKWGSIRIFNSTTLSNGTVMPGIRPVGGVYGGDDYDNVQDMIWNQEDEWKSFEEHQTASIDELEGLTFVEETSEVVYAAVQPANTSNNVVSVIGEVLTGDGNREWIYQEGPYEFSAIETIYRQTFRSKYSIALHTLTEVEYTGSVLPPHYEVTSTYPAGGISSYNNFGPAPRFDTTIVTVLSSGADRAAALQAAYASVPSFTVNFHNTSSQKTSTMEFVGPVTSGGTNYTAAFYTVYDPGTGAVISGPAPMNTNPGFSGLTGASFSASGGPILSPFTKTTRITKTYVATLSTGNLGYSEMRSMVKYWDLVEPSAYGKWELIKRVPAVAMDPLTWTDTYPEDLGSNIWQKGQYAGQNPIDLLGGSIGQMKVLPDLANGDSRGDPLFDAVTELLDQGLGVDSLLYESAIINGVVTLGRYEGETFVEGSFLRADYVAGQYTPGIYKLSTMQQNSVSITLPGSSFTMQAGSIEASYPTFEGALVYDLQLKRWGKYKGQHLVLADINALNSSINQGINYTALSTDTVSMKPDGKIYAFDTAPTDSWIRYGKAGYYRLGMTEAYEVRANFRSPSSCTVEIEGSFDGRAIDATRTDIGWVESEVSTVLNCSLSARWHSIKISGNYDLTGLELRGRIAGRR